MGEDLVTEFYRRLARTLALSTLLALLALAPSALAEGQPQPQYPDGPPQQVAPSPSDKHEAGDRLPPAAVTQHTISLAGEDVHYSAKAATLALRDAHGKTEVEIFYVAY